MSDKTPPPAFSDFNLQAITTKEYAETLSAAIEVGTNVAVFGRRGSGKTEIAKEQTAKAEVGESRAKVREVYVNLSVSERTDMGGYPDMFSKEPISNKEKFINYLLPKFFEPLIVGDQPAVVIFDEVDKADPSICAPLLEILQFKSINHRPLKNLRCSILTGNLISEGSARPSLPLLDRTEKYLLKPDTSSWLDWAGRSGKIHPSITSFLNNKNQFLFGSNDGSGDNYAEPSPRSWTNASYVLIEGEKLKWSKDLLNRKVAGFVGKQAGLEYEIFFNHYHELLPLVDRIMNGESVKTEFNKTLDPSKKLYTAMIVCSRLATILDNEIAKGADKTAPPKELLNVGKFLQYVEEEQVLVAVRTQLHITRLIQWAFEKHPVWGPILKAVTESLQAA